MYSGPDSILKYWGTTESGLYPKEWQAFWIWRKGEPAGTDLVIHARKQFTLTKQPQEAKLFITADNNYELYVNGIFANLGPARCQPHHQSYDILDIAPLLQAGENVLAIRAFHQGKFGSYNTPPRPGILAQLEMQLEGKMQLIKTDSTWKVKKPDEISLNSPVYGELVDFRKAETGWMEAGFDDSGWQEAEELVSDKFWPWPEPSPKAMPKTCTFPWETLVSRDLPYLKESLVKGKNLYEVGQIMELGYNNAVAEGANGLIFPSEEKSLDGMEKYQNGDGPLIIQNSYPSGLYSNDAIYSSYLIFDLGEVMHGYTHLELEGNSGTIVEVLYSTHLLRGKFPLRTNISGRPLTDRIILGKGKAVWDAMEMKYMRYLFIAVRNTDRPVKLFFSGIKKADYPFEPKGSFTVRNDDELEWLWKAASNTLRAVTTDAFTDNYRERLQYAQTSYYAARCSYAAFGDPNLQRRYLKQIAQEQQNDGILPASAPITSYKGQRFLDGSIFWIMGLHDYLLHTGDTKTVNELVPVAEKILNRFATWENKESIIDSPPYPYWIDHAAIDRYGANFSLNALYLLALQDFSIISEWTGNQNVSKEYAKRAEKLLMNLRTRFWDSQQKLFSDTWTGKELSSKFSEQSNSLAIVAGIASPEQQQEILKELIENNSRRLVPSVLFMHYLAESLFMTGHSTQAISVLKDRYRHMRKEGSETLWEEWSLTVSKRSGKFAPESARCNTQGEHTFLCYSLMRWILGIHPTKPGMAEVELSYNQREIKGSMPSPKGIISVEWKALKDGISLEVDIPRGVRAYVNLNNLNLNKKSCTLDGKSFRLAKNNPEIPSGKHIMNFY
jgi:hypothetical protein